MKKTRSFRYLLLITIFFSLTTNDNKKHSNLIILFGQSLKDAENIYIDFARFVMRHEEIRKQRREARKDEDYTSLLLPDLKHKTKAKIVLVTKVKRPFFNVYQKQIFSESWLIKVRTYPWKKKFSEFL